MKLATFFNKFDELADTPDGVKKVRELVLQLAVQGGLVAHSPDEAPVPYESIEDATAINVIEVPSNWRVVLLADAIKNRSGNSKLIKGKLHEEPAPGRFQGFSASGADVWCDDYEQEGEAIIISAVGARCGKAFKASGKWSAIANTNIARPEPTLFDFDFAYFVLNNEHFWIRGGSAQPFVKFPPSLDRHFALPPLAEQKRIVAKVDELMALCDRLEAQQQERVTRHATLARASLARFADAPTPANLQLLFHPAYAIAPADLRKSIRTLAVQGKLVPQDPNDEPGGVLLKKIQKDDAYGSSLLKRNSSIVEPTEFHDDIPEHWVWCELQEISEFINGKAHEQFVTDEPGFALVNSRLVSNSGRIFKYSTKQLTPLFRGDIALVMSDVPEGRALARCFVADEDDKYTLNQRIGCIRTSDLLCKTYLALVLDRNAYFLQYDDGKKQTNLKKIQIVSCPVPLPPLAEQRRIVAKVEQLMTLADELETQLAASRGAAAKLTEAMVSELAAAA